MYLPKVLLYMSSATRDGKEMHSYSPGDYDSGTRCGCGMRVRPPCSLPRPPPALLFVLASGDPWTLEHWTHSSGVWGAQRTAARLRRSRRDWGCMCMSVLSHTAHWTLDDTLHPGPLTGPPWSGDW
jgi:hypothetical protein